MANVSQLASATLSEGGGIFRLAPTWVPRSFLQPGRRLKLHPADYYALGMDRGGIDERWFGSTTTAANEGAPPPMKGSATASSARSGSHSKMRLLSWELRSSNRVTPKSEKAR